GAVLLHIGERPIVRVLQASTAGVEDVAVEVAGEHGCDSWLADVASVAFAEARDDVVEGRQLEYPDGVEELLAAQGEVLTQRSIDGESRLRQLALEHLLDERNAGAALRTRTAACLQRTEFGAA